MATQEMNEAGRFNRKFPGQKAPRQSDFLRKRLQGKGGGKYFDSGDYNMAKSAHDKTNPIGKAIPTPESLPSRKLSHSKQSNLIDGTSAPAHSTPEEKGMVESEEHKAKHTVIEEQDQ